MTNAVLQSDIELARRMIEDGDLDEEILGALMRRGIQPDRAMSVVEDLRAGRPVLADIIVPQTENRAEPAPQDRAAPAPPKHRRRTRNEELEIQGRVNWIGVLVLGLVCALVAYEAVIFFGNASPATAPPDASAGEASAAAQSTAAVDFEIAPNGLLVGGKPVNSSNLLAVLAAAAGPAARTNLTPAGDKLVYAFDRQGLLAYAPKSGGELHLLLHYEVLGGSNGVRTPFTGTLKIANSLVSASTPPETLRQTFGLRQLESGGGVLAGETNGVGLCFTYLSNLKQLSLVEIDLK